MRFLVVVCTCLLLLSHSLEGQTPSPTSSAALYQSLQKLNFLGSALYVAAHPDDENTRVIAYLSNATKAETAYLSLTRGDGGQNLIGPELRELLGVLRTQELLAARRVDGGKQFFSRANDFGYSKTPTETLEIWDKDAVLSDVVWAIRNFKPDVIINRFDHRTPGTTHGHHTASAMLSVEAFDLAHDPNAYPEQLTMTETWQPKRLFFNTSWWFYGSPEKFEAQADKDKFLSLDVGTYYPLLGLSNNEIASKASSQHLCQGFGRLQVRGSEKEYLELLAGDMPQDGNLFEGIDTSWSRMEGGAAVGNILYPLAENFNFTNPQAHLPQLLEAYKVLQQTPDSHWKRVKLPQLQELIAQVCGLYIAAYATEPFSNPGNGLHLELEMVNRSETQIILDRVQIPNTPLDQKMDRELASNQKQEIKLDTEISAATPYSTPYWLQEPWSLGLYTVKDQNLIGKPETPPAFTTQIHLKVQGTPIVLERPVVYRYALPEKGERSQRFEVLPKVTASLQNAVMVFNSDAPRTVKLTVRAGKNNVTGSAQLEVPSGWSVTPKHQNFTIAQKGDTELLSFKVVPPKGESEGHIRPKLIVDGQAYHQELVTIAYDHIPEQQVLLAAAAKVVRLDLQKAGQHIGYIAGAGDKIPESLEQIGYIMHPIDPLEIGSVDLQAYDAIVMGIRAYNVIPELQFKQPDLLEYVNRGGNLIVQYNTSRRNGTGMDNLAPYSLHVSRDRVTDENAQVTVLAPEHSLVNFPNNITADDFNGWVQERGLYFPDSWGKEFTPILAMHDQGESDKKGSLLVAPYGKGYYIYTGLSFFRELPAGVPGAYKLFANMLSVGKETLDQEQTPVKQ